MPLWLLLIPYAIFLLVFGVFSLVDLLNVWRFRTGFSSATFLVFVYILGTALILYTTYDLAVNVDWFQKIGLGLVAGTL
jgi:hypothetical protein